MDDVMLFPSNTPLTVISGNIRDEGGTWEYREVKLPTVAVSNNIMDIVAVLKRSERINGAVYVDDLLIRDGDAPLAPGVKLVGLDAPHNVVMDPFAIFRADLSGDTPIFHADAGFK